MKQWDIYLFHFSAEGAHPAVILSADELCEHPQILTVNALICRSIRPDKPARKHEVTLDQTEGLDRPTAVRCDHIKDLPKEKFLEKRGRVESAARRKAIVRKIHEVLRLPPVP